MTIDTRTLFAVPLMLQKCFSSMYEHILSVEFFGWGAGFSFASILLRSWTFPLMFFFFSLSLLLSTPSSASSIFHLTRITRQQCLWSLKRSFETKCIIYPSLAALLLESPLTRLAVRHISFSVYDNLFHNSLSRTVIFLTEYLPLWPIGHVEHVSHKFTVVPKANSSFHGGCISR